jgi:hypothetical protein
VVDLADVLRLLHRDDVDDELDLGSAPGRGTPQADRPLVAPLGLLDMVAGPDSVVDPADVGTLETCPVAPELLRFAV